MDLALPILGQVLTRCGSVCFAEPGCASSDGQVRRCVLGPLTCTTFHALPLLLSDTLAGGGALPVVQQAAEDHRPSGVR